MHELLSLLHLPFMSDFGVNFLMLSMNY